MAIGPLSSNVETLLALNCDLAALICLIEETNVPTHKALTLIRERRLEIDQAKLRGEFYGQ